MRRALADGYEIDDDPARVDLGALHRFLSEESAGAGMFREWRAESAP